MIALLSTPTAWLVGIVVLVVLLAALGVVRLIGGSRPHS